MDTFLKCVTALEKHNNLLLNFYRKQIAQVMEIESDEEFDKWRVSIERKLLKKAYSSLLEDLSNVDVASA